MSTRKDLKKTARGLASLGRGQDKMLVHMTPHEVAGLQKLAVASGGSLTLNPHTGLPEAGWLSSLLPLVAGAAATFMTGGAAAPAWAAMLAGAAGGAGGAAIEGEDPLMGGVMGALGGQFGGGVTSGLMGKGASAIGQAATQNAAKVAAEQSAAQAAQVAAAPTAQAAAAQAVQPISQAANLAAIPMPAAAISNQSALQAGIGSLGEKGALTGLWGGLKPTAKLGAGTTAMGAMNAASTSSSGGGKKSKPMYYHTSAEIDPNGYTSFGPGYWSKDYNYETLGTNPPNDDKYADVRKKTKYYAAEGGEVPPANNGMQDLANYYKQQIANSTTRPPVDTSANQAYMDRLHQIATTPPPMPSQPVQQPISTLPTPIAAMTNPFASTVVQTSKKKKKKKDLLPQPVHYNFSYDNGFTPMNAMRKGGIAGLKGKGRKVRGQGDGVSDSIKAEIKGKKSNQPAALSDGEFVVPARHVSEIGNGSTDAGAKRLYAMLDRIEQRRKTTSYANDSGAHQELPA